MVKNIIFTFLLTIPVFIFSQVAGISAIGDDPAESSILDVKSSN